MEKLDMKMYAFIINPIAGNGKCLKIWRKIKKSLEEQRVIYRSFFTKYAGHAEEIAQQIGSLHEDQLVAIIAVGGDGTAFEVINGISNYPDLPFGFIPVGINNKIGQGLSISRKPLQALDRILNKRQAKTKIDLGNYHLGGLRKSKLFVSQLDMGLEAEVSKHINEAPYTSLLTKLACGKIAFLLSFVRILFSFAPQSIQFTIDGQEKKLDKVWLVGIANLAHPSKGINVALEAKLTDGKLRLYIIHDLSPWKLLLVFATSKWGKHLQQKKGITIFQGKSIVVTTDANAADSNLTVQVDGELIGNAPIAVNIRSQSRLMI